MVIDQELGRGPGSRLVTLASRVASLPELPVPEHPAPWRVNSRDRARLHAPLPAPSSPALGEPPERKAHASLTPATSVNTVTCGLNMPALPAGPLEPPSRPHPPRPAFC